MHITGVVRRGDRWIAFVQFEGRRTYIGSYDSIYEAVVGQEEFRAKHGLVTKPETTVAKARANKKASNAKVVARVVKAPRASAGLGLPTGIARCGPKFHAYLQYDNKRKYIGSYDSVEDAVLAQQQFREAHNLPYPTERKMKTLPIDEFEFSPEEEEAAANSTGIIQRGARWLAFVQYLGKRHYVGSYATAAHALAAQTKFREENPGANIGPDSARLTAATAPYVPTHNPTFTGGYPQHHQQMGIVGMDPQQQMRARARPPQQPDAGGMPLLSASEMLQAMIQSNGRSMRPGDGESSDSDAGGPEPQRQAGGGGRRKAGKK
jgi:hypothetical protein